MRHALVVEQTAVIRDVSSLPEALLWWAAAHFVLHQKTAYAVKTRSGFFLHMFFSLNLKSPTAAVKAEIDMLLMQAR